MTEYLYFSTFIEYRIPIDDSGRAGSPEVTRKFTNPMKSKGLGAEKNMKKQQKEIKTENRGVEYL